MRFIILSIIAVVAIVAGFAVMQMTKPAPVPVAPPPPPVMQQDAPRTEVAPKTANVLVARTAIPVGTEIKENMVDIQPWPANLVVDGFIVGNAGAGSDAVVGKVARSSIQAHEPFLKSKLADTKDPGYLAAELPAGKRAITIATDVVSGIAGYVFPGDRVDVILTHNVPAELDETKKMGNSGKPSLAEVLVVNARVLAVNVRDITPNGQNQNQQNVSPTSTTLEVTDEDAQRVRLAEKQGTLSLSLRSIKDDNDTMPNPTRLTDLSHIGVFGKGAPSDGGEGDLLITRGPSGHKGQITSSKTVSGVVISNSALENNNTGTPPVGAPR